MRMLVPPVFVLLLLAVLAGPGARARADGAPGPGPVAETAGGDDLGAQLGLARRLYAGQEDGRDRPRAFGLVKSLAEKGHADSQVQLGRYYLDGGAVPRDPEEARSWFLKAADQGSAQGLYLLGVTRDVGQGLPRARDAPGAAERLRLAAEKGDPEAQTGLGAIYSAGIGIDRDYAESARWFRLAAEQGVPEAQYRLGYMSHLGRGMPQDLGQALAWYGRAAEGGHPGAQTQLGLAYLNGQGVERDLDAAMGWLQKAAGQGLALAQTLLGVIYFHGFLEIAEDKPKALGYWRLAAQGGDDLAQFHLASAYCDGAGTGRDLAEAARWFRLAADQGLSTAQLNLGLILLEAGDGGREEAERYLGLAADLGLAAARDALDGLEAGTAPPRPCGP